jgi:two-component system cell cycle response regulator
MRLGTYRERPAVPAEDAHAEDHPPTMNRRKILIVEGSVTQRAMLKDMVAKEGYEAVETAAGADATERLRMQDIDAVLINWELVDTTGPELCRRWQESGEFDLIPFLIITSHTDAEHVRESLDAGATDFIRKPPNQVELFARLRLALRMRDLRIELHENSIRDALTGLYNRRHIQTELDRHCEAAKRYGEIFSVAMIDIDLFKSINDSHGHAMGDTILRQMSEYLRGRMRKTDIVGRFGGEEFLIVLHATPLAQAGLALESLRKGMADRRFGTDDVVVNVTFSAGVASWSPALGNAQDLIKKADDGLYASKQAGRNRIILVP